MILLLFFEEEYTSARKIPLTLQLGEKRRCRPTEETPMVLVGVVPPPSHPHSKERYTSFKLLVPMLCRVHRVMGSISFFRWNFNFLDAVSFPWKKFSPSSKKGITPSVVLLGKIHSLRRIFVPAGIFLYYTGSALCKVCPFFCRWKALN